MGQHESRITDGTRRRFMSHFAGLGLGATLAPGVLWARMQDQGADQITLDMVTDALKLAGIDATEEERRSMVAGANQALGRYEAVRQMDIPIDVSSHSWTRSGARRQSRRTWRSPRADTAARSTASRGARKTSFR